MTLDWRQDQNQYHVLSVPLTLTNWVYVAALPEQTFEAAARDFLRIGRAGRDRRRAHRGVCCRSC